MKTPLTFRLLLACLPLVFFVMFACQRSISDGNDANGPAALKIYLTDHQTPVFDSIFIDMQKLEVKLEDDTLRNNGWVPLSIRPGVYNVLRFRNGVDTLFAAGTLPNNRIRKLRLTLGTQNRLMLDGQTAPLAINDNDRQVVISLTNANVDISAGQVFFWLDFDAGNSIKINNSGPGNGNGYELKAHIKAFGKNNTGRIEGRVLPAAANPVVKAVQGADTATALPERGNGEFKIVGLDAGVYTVLIEGHNGYRDSVLQNVRIANREDTKLSAIVLHQ